jgi:outer membrane receptor for ferrienterochelin and colicin
VGRGARAARPVFEEVCCGQQYQSNIELELEDSLSGAIEAAWQPSPRFRIGAYTHRTTFRDHIVRMVGYSFGGIQTYAQANVPRARYTGLTLTSRIQLPEKLTVDLACSWLDAVNSSGRRVPMTLYPFDNTPHEYLIPMTDIPYRVRRGGSAAILWTSGQERIEATLQAQFQGPTSIQHWNIFPIAVPIPPFDGYPLCRSTTTGQNSLVCDDTQVTPSFWIVNARATFHPKPWIAIHAGVDNIGDYVQDDLSDPTNDNNWGPIRGRYMYAGVTVTP